MPLLHFLPEQRGIFFRSIVQKELRAGFHELIEYFRRGCILQQRVILLKVPHRINILMK